MDFSKLTDGELEKIAGGAAESDMSSMSDEELERIANPPGKLESLGRGALQGATLGFADEISGAVESAFTDKTYDQARDESRANFASAKKANPGTYGTGEIGAGIATAFVPGLNIAKGASLGKAALQSGLLGGAMGAGYSDADNAGDVALDTLKGGAIGGVTGGALQKAMPYVEKGIGKLAAGLGRKAEDLAVNATGATGLQASKFDDDAGRQLLDRGLVKAFDNPEKIAGRVGAAKQAAGSNIDEALRGLDSQGFTASADNVVADLRQKIAQLKQDPSQASITRKLEGIVEDILATGKTNVPISQAEQTKRGFSKMAGNWMDPEVGQAGKQAYLSYMDEVERAAKASDLDLSKLFKEGKETFGLLAPIEEAASRRAMTQNQSPWGGLGDMAAAGTGMLGGGPVGAAVGVAGKKMLAPRMTSTAAVGLDGISKLLQKSPQMAELARNKPQVFNALAQKMERSLGGGASRVAEEKPKAPDSQALMQKTQGTKYAQVLANAQQRGNSAVGATHFILQNQDPEYRKLTLEQEDDW